MNNYIYPAIFQWDNSEYSVSFPDLHNCFTGGANLKEAREMAEEELSLTLNSMKSRAEKFPPATDIRQVQVGKGTFVSLISCRGAG